MNDPAFIWRFSPSRTDPDTLEAIFVQRHALLDDVLERVAESATTGNKHHLLLVGPRGIGKTHFIALLHHRVSKDRAVADRLRVAWLNEDETTVSFVQLLVRIYRALADAYPQEFPLDILDGLPDLSGDDMARQLQANLVERLGNRTILLLVENLDLLFANLGDEGQKRWRAFLQERPLLCTVATSQQLFEDVSRRQNPFFGFFETIHLKPLSIDEATTLMTRIAEQNQQRNLVQYLRTPEGRSRIRALHHLAGGNHRVYIALSDFVNRESLDELVGPFQKMLDELTPYYQERIRSLSPQQRQIVEFLCTQTSPCPVKKIARNLLASENTVGGQMKKLRELGYVMTNTRGRESLYELTEPMMRLAQEVKETGAKPLRLIVDFLRVWYRRDELEGKLRGAVGQITYDHVSAAISLSNQGDDPRMRAIQEAIDAARSQGRLDEAILVLEEKAHVTNASQDWFELAYYLADVKRFEEAIAYYDRALQVDPKNAYVWNNKGHSLNEMQRFEEAIACCDRALLIDPENAYVWNNKGNSLNGMQRFEEAIECCDRALQIDPQFAYAWNNKGNALSGMRRFDKAIQCYDRALLIDPEPAYAWNNKGVALNGLQRFEEATECFERASQIDPELAPPRFNICEALFALRRWQDGFDRLRHAFASHPANAGHDSPSIVHLIHRHSEGKLRDHVRELVAIYGEAGQLANLSDGLVRSLAKTDAGMMSKKALYLLRDVWLREATGKPELEIALRIYRVGIEYLATQDERVLLDLIETERRIAVQALGLNHPATNEGAARLLSVAG